MKTCCGECGHGRCHCDRDSIYTCCFCERLTIGNGFRIPGPPDKPHYHEYASGAPGDYRNLEIRLAERLLEEERNVVDAIRRAFRAGRAYQIDNREAAL